MELLAAVDELGLPDAPVSSEPHAVRARAPETARRAESESPPVLALKLHLREILPESRRPESGGVRRLGGADTSSRCSSEARSAPRKAEIRQIR